MPFRGQARPSHSSSTVGATPCRQPSVVGNRAEGVPSGHGDLEIDGVHRRAATSVAANHSRLASRSSGEAVPAGTVNVGCQAPVNDPIAGQARPGNRRQLHRRSATRSTSSRVERESDAAERRCPRPTDTGRLTSCGLRRSGSQARRGCWSAFTPPASRAQPRDFADPSAGTSAPPPAFEGPTRIAGVHDRTDPTGVTAC